MTWEVERIQIPSKIICTTSPMSLAQFQKKKKIYIYISISFYLQACMLYTDIKEYIMGHYEWFAIRDVMLIVVG